MLVMTHDIYYCKYITKYITIVFVASHRTVRIIFGVARENLSKKNILQKRSKNLLKKFQFSISPSKTNVRSKIWDSSFLQKKRHNV